MSGTDDLIEPFVVEARDLILRARGDLAVLRRQPGAAEDLDSLFRAIHTLKGSAGLMDLPVLVGLLHAAEAGLEAAREEGELPGWAHAQLTEALDGVETWVDGVETGVGASDAQRDATARITRRLEAWRPVPEDASEAATREADGGDASPHPNEAIPSWARDLTTTLKDVGDVVALRYRPASDAYFHGDDPLAIVRGVPDLLKLDLKAPATVDRAGYDPFHCALVVTAVSAAPIEAVRTALRFVSDQVEIVPVTRTGPALSPRLRLRSLHVEAARLDAVAALVDELVIAKNALAHENRRLLAALAGTGAGLDLLTREAALERIVGELHAAVTGLRLTPLGQLFARFPRQVREVAAGLGKTVEFRVSGEDVVLDKSVVEGLFEPLLHLLRNAVDHGVEPVEARRAAGKPVSSTISLTARAEGADVVVEVADDGRGVDAAVTRALAVRRGLLDPAAAEALSEAAAAELIFAAGFSTAGQVSDLSGRGVGMDAVRAAIGRLGGQVTLDNRPGEGLVVRLRVPAQVRLAKILTVRVGDERFGVPLEAVEETHRVRQAELTTIRQGEAFVRRDAVIPLVDLARLLGSSLRRAETFPVLTLMAAGERVGVQVDAVGERVEVPLRPMSGLMAGYPGVLGTVLQGDGQVMLVLDLAELAA